MTKLKCWKKIGKGKYKHKTKELSVHIGKSSFYKKPIDYTIYYGNPFKPHVKEITKKSQALKFANKYIKEHDKC